MCANTYQVYPQYKALDTKKDMQNVKSPSSNSSIRTFVGTQNKTTPVTKFPSNRTLLSVYIIEQTKG